jgi:hypothetical protein
MWRWKTRFLTRRTWYVWQLWWWNVCNWSLKYWNICPSFVTFFANCIFFLFLPPFIMIVTYSYFFHVTSSQLSDVSSSSEFTDRSRCLYPWLFWELSLFR